MLLDFTKLVENFDLKIKGVIHIGAHFGTENEVYKKFDIKNKIFFEPLPHTFKILENNVRDSILVNKALGNDTKKINMYVERENCSQSSSILKPKIHATQYAWITFKEMMEVDMIKLDDYPLEQDKYNFINIDVQGYELEVFKGATKTLENIDYIMSEINRAELYENCVLVDQLDKFLKNYGFERVATTWDGGTWGDGFYIKKK
jgi:FkbM family methyltransferase